MTGPAEGEVWTLTTSEVVAVFLSGVASGVGTGLLNAGVSHEHTHAAARASARRLDRVIATDPAVRETLLDDLRSAIATGQPPGPRFLRTNAGGSQ